MNEYLAEATKHARLVHGFGTEEQAAPTLREDAARRTGARDWLAHTYSWAIPSEEAVAALVEVSPLVEIGAGGGYWAKLIREAGGEVEAFDENPTQNEWAKRRWSKVQAGDEYAVAAYPNHSLFLCWPPDNDLMAEWTLDYYMGDVVAYVGEHEGGVCATPGFFAMLDRDFEQERQIDIPRFWGISDYLSIWRRR